MSTKQRSLGDILQEFSQHRQIMQQELQKVIIGQSEVIEQLFAAIFTRGHCLLEGVPGVASLSRSTPSDVLPWVAVPARLMVPDPVERIVGRGDFLATIYQHLGIDFSHTDFKDYSGRPVPIMLSEGRPIPELRP